MSVMPKVKVEPRQTTLPAAESSDFEVASAMTGLGDTVAYYENGDKSQQPQVAIVSNVTPTGLCLHVLSPRGISVRDYTRHIDDPWFAALDQRQKTLNEKGAWDTLQSARRRLDEMARQRRLDVLRRQQAEEANKQDRADEEPLLDEVAMKAEELARQGFALPDIAAQLRGEATVGQIRNHFENNMVSA